MLNNRGWGFRTFIIMGAILLLALLLVTFLVMRLYSQLPNLNYDLANPVSYRDIEDTITNASRLYYEDYYKNEISSGVLVISTNNLIKYGLLTDNELIETNVGDECKGYTIIKRDDKNKLVYNTYIECKKYETEGYQKWRLSENE